ncbi:MAG: hypothetical protein IKX57_07460 [Oscillospiraceae bacterium]|nr:hypothetical protein [Oscillospiraceae bacterium]
MFKKNGITYESEEEYMHAKCNDELVSRSRLSKKERVWLIAVLTVLFVLLALFVLIPETPPKYLPMLL